MKKDNLDTLFERLANDFDLESPDLGHQQRFLNKLQDKSVTTTIPKKTVAWKPLLAIAASIILCFALFITINQERKLGGLASVSPELSETQSFFSSAIEQELKSLKEKRSPKTNALIDDALEQLDLLEKDYEKLKVDLAESGNDKRVVYAMIANFQSRIDVLEHVMDNIETLKGLNNESNNIL
ncbi:hypothetical protein [Sediminibacter sp. Hel_I_10]|uniref:hypothetical protein n=1 Tax=Sediminibacter sp. Hel_I_10 TaxID=1392490 RepID=UPI0004795B44|nr:hypothetical protein [Sediminibacter sp. Hel_I_10]